MCLTSKPPRGHIPHLYSESYKLQSASPTQATLLTTKPYYSLPPHLPLHSFARTSPHHLTLCPPAAPQRYLHSLDLKQLPYYRRECLCRTVQDRRLDMITISSPANLIRDATVTAVSLTAPVRSDSSLP